MKHLEDQVITLIRTSPLGRFADELSGLLRRAISLRTQDSENGEIPVGTSKIGGLPDLPPEQAWPMGDHGPMTLLAQICLNDMAPYDHQKELPPSGMLSFFLDLTTQGEFYPVNKDDLRVLYWDGDRSTLTRRPAPTTDLWMYGSRMLTFSSLLMLPSSSALDEFLKEETMEDLEELDEKLEAYEHLTEKIEALFDFSASPRHQLLGYSSTIVQYNIESWNERLLLQMDTDWATDFNWGDCGILYLTIAPEELAARDFSRVDASVQGH